MYDPNPLYDHTYICQIAEVIAIVVSGKIGWNLCSTTEKITSSQTKPRSSMHMMQV